VTGLPVIQPEFSVENFMVTQASDWVDFKHYNGQEPNVDHYQNYSTVSTLKTTKNPILIFTSVTFWRAQNGYCYYTRLHVTTKSLPTW